MLALFCCWRIFEGRIVTCMSKFAVYWYVHFFHHWMKPQTHWCLLLHKPSQSLSFSLFAFPLISFSLSSSFIHKVIVRNSAEAFFFFPLADKQEQEEDMCSIHSLTATRENIASTQLIQPTQTNKQHCLNRSSGWWEQCFMCFINSGTNSLAPLCLSHRPWQLHWRLT